MSTSLHEGVHEVTAGCRSRVGLFLVLFVVLMAALTAGAVMCLSHIAPAGTGNHRPFLNLVHLSFLPIGLGKNIRVHVFLSLPILNSVPFSRSKYILCWFVAIPLRSQML